MGNGVPGGIAAQLSYPEKQVFTLSGDGGFAMVMQDIITQVKYQLPIINVVFLMILMVSSKQNKKIRNKRNSVYF